MARALAPSPAPAVPPLPGLGFPSSCRSPVAALHIQLRQLTRLQALHAPHAPDAVGAHAAVVCVMVEGERQGF